jgi:hypothetical protein
MPLEIWKTPDEKTAIGMFTDYNVSEYWFGFKDDDGVMSDVLRAKFFGSSILAAYLIDTLQKGQKLKESEFNEKGEDNE